MTNRVFPETHALLATHAELDVNPSIEPWPYEEVRARCRYATGLFVFMTDRIDAPFFAACPSLRVIGAALKGYDNIDVAAATEAGVWVTIVPDLLTVPTAELAIGITLALSRHIIAGDRSIREHDFNGWRPQFYGAGLCGATVGIAGFGRVGRAIAERLVPFACRQLGRIRARCSRATMHRDDEAAACGCQKVTEQTIKTEVAQDVPSERPPHARAARQPRTAIVS